MAVTPLLVGVIVVALGAGLAAAGLLVYRDRVRRPREWQRSQQGLPAAAARLGLCFEPARRLDEIGILEGEVGGHQVRITPDEPDVKIRVALRRPLSFGWLHAADRDGPRGGLTLADPAFARSWGPRLRLLRVERTGLECAPRDGARDPGADPIHERYYLLPEHLEALLPALVTLAERLDATPAAHDQEA